MPAVCLYFALSHNYFFMGNITDTIRKQLEEGENETALDALVGFLKTIGGDLYNQAILVKGKYKEYQREKRLGLGAQPEVMSQTILAILALADQIDQQNLENPPTQQDFKKMRPDAHLVQQRQQPPKQPSQPPAQSPYIAQCFFNGDMAQYFVSPQNQIFMVNPMTNQTLIVGMKMPSQDQRFAWTYYMNASGNYYLVDHAGLIWGQSFGMPFQMGYVKYF